MAFLCRIGFHRFKYSGDSSNHKSGGPWTCKRCQSRKFAIGNLEIVFEQE